MPVNPTGMIVQLVVSLAIVIGMVWLLVKFLSLKSKWMYRNRPLKVLGGVGLGPQKSLQLVEIGGVLYILGVGQDITLLKVIDDPEEKERIMRDFATSTAKTGSSWLERLRSKSGASSQDTDFTSVLSSQLGAVRRQRERALSDWLNGRELPVEREIKD